MTAFQTMADVKRANRAKGHHWFSTDTMRWFRCKIESELIAGRLFVTSERFDDGSPRLFTVRKVYPDADIGTVGEFQEHRTKNAALAAAHAALTPEAS
jgi:hypothetical protein